MSNHSPRLDYREKEFPMTNKYFQRIADLAGRYTGIVLGEHKQDMVYGRIARRVRKLHLMSFTAYLDFLEENLEKATLTLQIDKSWVSENNLNKEDISLFKFDENLENWKH